MAGSELRYDTVSFLSDYGRADEFVGIVHSVLRALAPGVGVVDVTHDIAPFDVSAGALTLARSAQYLCPGVVLAVVDPGVGTSRRGVAIEVGDGASVLVGPDNGLLAPAVSMVGGAGTAVELDNAEYHLPGGGNTFDGRDVFAPAVAALCRGVGLADLGTEVDPASLLPATLPLSRQEPDGLHTEVLWVDRFGNAQLNLDPDDLPEGATAFTLSAAGRTHVAQRAGTFDDVPPGSFGLVVDSYGLVAAVLARASAVEALGVAAGEEVVLSPTDAPAGVEVEVELGVHPDRRGAP
ncbi:MAG: SAM-dependent chlorinase/fluorinase [Actinomycetia bacterium]|nr:SAM-dependent chlorinase/fluorinase [Actinomycetes bacterium]